MLRRGFLIRDRPSKNESHGYYLDLGGGFGLVGTTIERTAGSGKAVCADASRSLESLLVSGRALGSSNAPSIRPAAFSCRVASRMSSSSSSTPSSRCRRSLIERADATPSQTLQTAALVRFRQCARCRLVS